MIQFYWTKELDMFTKVILLSENQIISDSDRHSFRTALHLKIHVNNLNYYYYSFNSQFPNLETLVPITIGLLNLSNNVF